MGTTVNLVDEIWGSGRTPRPNEKAKVLDIRFSGKKFEEKIEHVRKELAKKKSAGIIICEFLDRSSQNGS